MERSAATTNTTSSHRLSICATVLGILIGIAAIWAANRQSLGLFHDDGIYAVVAKAIYQGDGYHIISLPTAPAQTKYPFLYSYLLSFLWRLNPVFPANIPVLKAFNAALLVAIFFFAVGFYRRLFAGSTIAPLVFAILVCTNPILFTYTDYVVSDLLFVLLVLVVLFLAMPSIRNIPFFGVVAGMACLTRLAAAPLVFAGVIHTYLRRGWRGMIGYSAIVFLLVTPWFVWLSFDREASGLALLSYYTAYDFSSSRSEGVGEWLVSHGTVVTSNLRHLFGSFEMLYLLPLMPWLLPFVVSFTALGMIVSFRREEIFSWAFFLFSVGLLLFWPFHPIRYLAPLVPLLILFLFRGMSAGERWVKANDGEYPLKRLWAKIIWTPAALVLLLNGFWLSSYLLISDEQTTRGLYGSRMPFSWEGFEESFAWIRQNTAPNATLGTAYDPMYFLYTGRRAIRPALHRSFTYFYPYGQAQPDVGSVGEVKPELEKLKIDYLIIDPLDGYAEGKATIKLLDDLVASYGDKAKHAFTSRDRKHRIYALTRD